MQVTLGRDPDRRVAETLAYDFQWDQTASGRMVVSMLGVVAQWEQEAIGERTAFALAHKRRNGEAYAPTAFGYRRDASTLIPDEAEQDALEEALRMDRDVASFREIGRMLNSSL